MQLFSDTYQCFGETFCLLLHGKKVKNSNNTGESSTQICLCGRVGGTDGGWVIDWQRVSLKKDWLASSIPFFLSLNLSYPLFGGVLFSPDNWDSRFFILETMAQFYAMKRRRVATDSTLNSHWRENVKTGWQYWSPRDKPATYIHKYNTKVIHA